MLKYGLLNHPTGVNEVPKITPYHALTNEELILFIEFRTPTQELIEELLRRFCRMVDERKQNAARAKI